MASPASVHLKALLTTYIATSDWVIEVGSYPDEPERVIVIADTMGETPNPKWLLDFPSCQVMVRGNVNDYLAAYNVAKDVKDLLLGADSHDNDGDRIVSITMKGDGPHFIGRDEDRRPMFSMNFALIIEPQVVANSNRIAL